MTGTVGTRRAIGHYWWLGQKIDQDCYGVAYLNGDEILKKKEGCVETKETCSVEDGAVVVIRTISNKKKGEDSN